MNELTKLKYRILARIETYIGDIELAEEQDLTEDEKTIFESVKDIINEEFTEATLDPTLPRFIINANGKIEQIKTSDEKESTYYDVFRFKKMLVKEDREKFQKFLDEHERLYAEAMKRAEAEQIIKSVIKEYIDKDCDDVTEMLLTLSIDLCERIKSIKN